MLGYLKKYYIFMLILMVLSFLVPRDEYKTYIQFFIGVFLTVLFLEPVLKVLTMDDPSFIYQMFNELNQEIEEATYEFVFFEGKEE